MKAVLARFLTRRFYETPIFQVGSSRSGTIVLYKALGTHPQILSMPSEDPLVTYIASVVKPFEPAFGEENARYFQKSVKLSKRAVYARLQTFLFESAAGPDLGFKEMVRAVVRERVAYFKKRMWCVKCFPEEEDARALRILYPRAKFLYIVRNGIDVVQSRRNFPVFREQTFESHCEFWRRTAANFAYLLDADYAVSLRQEELLHDPEAVFARIYKYLGIDSHPNPLNFVRSTLVHSRADEETHTNVDVRRALMEREPSYSTWSSSQQESFKRICGGEMNRLGYEIPF